MTNAASILDGTLDDIADLPEFKAFPAGTHQCTIVFAEKKIGEHPSVEVKLKAITTIELAEPSDIAPQAGDEAGIAYMLDNEIGLGKFKALLAQLAPSFGLDGTAAPRAIMEASKGAEVMATTKVRVDKNDKDKKYTEIHKIAVV